MNLNRIIGAFMWVMVLCFLAHADDVARATDTSAMRRWSDTHLLKDASEPVPFSFPYGGAPSRKG